jgi:ribosomal protein S18 acetylase RimI-like enzyme
MNVSIERAELEDLAEVSKLFADYLVFYERESHLDSAHAFLTGRVKNAESVIFYARTDNGRYVGFTQLYPSFSSLSLERTWILNDLYVAKEARRKGIATRLMNAAKDYAVETDAGGITLETATTNTTAQSLYESLGYEKDTGFFTYFLKL